MAFVKRTPLAPADQDERTRPRDVAGLRETLLDPDPAARRRAARDLSRYPEAAADLVAHLDREGDAAVREAILIGLAEIGNAVAVRGLADCLRSEDAALRNEAIEAMKNLPDAVTPIMSDLLADDDPDVRIFAVNILESLRHPDVEKWLIAVIREDAHVNVCATAVDLLGEVGSESAARPLQDLKRRFEGEPYIAFAADLALRRIRGS